MVTIRGWWCTRACDPTRPCFAPGCPNSRQPCNPNPYFFPGFGPRPRYNPGRNPYYNPNPPPFRGHLGFRPPRPPPPPNPMGSYPNQNDPDGALRIGVGNVSSTDIEIDIRDNLTTGARNRVNIGSGNRAARSNMGSVSNNQADADDLVLGSDNWSKGGDNDIRVTNNDFRGFGLVRVGSGNYARGSNRIVVDALGSDNNTGPQQGGHQRRRWLF
ncbi:uncharacterized protein A4U43_C08F33990 [Asparagus officinalis]|nr:uncharacterized protein A4U43_C08F33990 [Asparagus officinalis]